MPQQPYGQYRLAPALVNTIHALRGFHPGYRAVHALGRIYRGTFTATGDGAAVTRAVHFQPGAVVPATARFSLNAADPDAPPNAITAMGTKFYLDDGTVTDMVGLNLPVFPAAAPDDILALAAAIGDEEKPAAYAASHPKFVAAVKLIATVQAPKSFAETAFNAIHAF